MFSNMKFRYKVLSGDQVICRMGSESMAMEYLKKGYTVMKWARRPCGLTYHWIKWGGYSDMTMFIKPMRAAEMIKLEFTV